MAEKILVVEDERNIASFVAMYLKNARYQVDIARDGTEALQKADSTKPDLVVLDLMLPDIDGLEVCRQIRSTSDVPILMLTARDDDVDKIVGLEVGADDYLTKPFNPRELVARIKSILRRSSQTARSSRPQEAAMEHGNLRIDAGRREVTVSGRQVQLAPKEFDLLWELLDHRGLVLTRDQLLERGSDAKLYQIGPGLFPNATKVLRKAHINLDYSTLHPNSRPVYQFSSDGATYIGVGAPIFSGPQPIGAVVLAKPLADVNNAW